MYSSENLSKGQIIYFFNYKSKAIKEVLSTANEKHFFLQCQLKPFWLLFDTPTYTVKYLVTLYRFPKTLSPSLNLPSSLKPTQHSTDSQEEKGSGTTATGFHLSISYSGKKKKSHIGTWSKSARGLLREKSVISAVTAPLHRQDCH